MATVNALSEAKRSLLLSYLSAPAVRTGVAPCAINARPSGELAPLTISQEQLVLREMRRPDAPPLYNECIQVRMSGPLDIAALQRSYRDVINRHEIWRTTYQMDNGKVYQVIHPPCEQTELPLIDLQGFSRGEQDNKINQVIGTLVRQPFGLNTGPLLRPCLVKINELEHRLFVVAHLSIVDGLSVYQIFPTELSNSYGAHVCGRSAEFPSLPIQFADYSHWQRRQMHDETLNQQLDYWQMQLAGNVPALNWPLDRSRPSCESFRGEIENFVLPAQLAKSLKTLARTENVTLFMVVLSILAVLLHSYTRQDDFTIGTPSPSGRKRSDVQKLLGYFLTPVALRFRITRKMTFRELLRLAQRLTLEAISNDDVPVEVLAQKLNIPADESRNPLFTVATSLQPPMLKMDLDWVVTSMDINSGGAPWDLYLAFIDRPEGMLGRVQYNPDLFEAEAIARFIVDYQNLAEVLSTTPETQISSLNFPAQ